MVLLLNKFVRNVIAQIPRGQWLASALIGGLFSLYIFSRAAMTTKHMMIKVFKIGMIMGIFIFWQKLASDPELSDAIVNGLYGLISHKLIGCIN